MKQIKYIIAILLLYPIWGCSKEEILQPDILVSIEITGVHRALYGLNGSASESNGNTLNVTLISKLNDIVDVKVYSANKGDVVNYKLSINGVQVDKATLQGNFTGYEIKLQLTKEYLNKKGCYDTIRVHLSTSKNRRIVSM